MNRDSIDWSGFISAIPTPFSSRGDIEYTQLEGVVHHVAELGASGIVVNGSTGEWFAQSDEERKGVASFVIDKVNGTVPTIVGICAMNPQTSIALARSAHEAHADGVLLSPPPASRLTNDELVQYYRFVCKSVKLPVMVYNIPADGVMNLGLDVLGQLTEIPNVVAIKDHPPNELDFYEAIDKFGDSVRMFGSLVNPVGAAFVCSGYGGDGYVGSGMPLGSQLAEFFEAARAGKYSVAADIGRRFVRLMRALGEASRTNAAFGGMHAQCKTIMKLSGCDVGVPRPPRHAITDRTALDAISEMLREAGVTVVPVS